jgi:hypothetical protein
VWLPGKTLSFNNSGENKDFEILIPGNYVIESKKQILIDGVLLAPGTKLLLLEGNHVAQALYKKQKTILRWDELKYYPKTSTPPIATFYGF